MGTWSTQIRENEAIRVYRFLFNHDRMIYGGAAYKRMKELIKRNRPPKVNTWEL